MKLLIPIIFFISFIIKAENDQHHHENDHNHEKEKTKNLEAHQHGVSKLNIVQENNKIIFEFVFVFTGSITFSIILRILYVDVDTTPLTLDGFGAWYVLWYSNSSPVREMVLNCIKDVLYRWDAV